MNKRIKKKKTKESYYIYRGILVSINGPYSFRGRNIVVFYPDSEGYRKKKCGVKASIDRFLSTYIKIDNEIPF